ncbi:MAG: caspase family protein [Chitinophagaceae bacterium]|nr:caspase family protein [Chitinophagaceae bacterium]
MRKILIFVCVQSFILSGVNAQSVYELSFSVPNGTGNISYNALFVDYLDGKGNVRLRFAAPGSTDSLLADFAVQEEFAEPGALCSGEDLLFYKLQNPRFIESTDPAVILPAYFCFKKEPLTGLYEPLGIANSQNDCIANINKFSAVALKTQNEITKEYVLTYFKAYEPFYRSLFVTNNAKALTNSERNVKLYLLFVANVTDAEIGIADRKNMTEAISFFGKIKDFLGISAFIYDTVTGRDFNKEKVLNKINTFLTPAPNDIVIFYYSGHGFRQPRDGRPGPYMDMRDLVIDKKKKYLENALSSEDIVQQIRKKGARLNLILTDCCNDNVTSTNPMATDPAIVPKKGFGLNWSVQNCRDLFLNAMPTTILAAAASPYQLGISNPQFGGYFSTLFRNAVETHLGFSKTKVTWDSVFAQTKQQTEFKASRTWCNVQKTIKCNRQMPYVNIMYGRF